MYSLRFLFLGLVCLASISEASHQKKIDKLFYNDDITTTLSVEDLKKLKLPDGVIESFLSEYETGLLPKTTPFSLRDSHIKEETIKIFDLLYFTSNFDEFYEVAKLLNSLMNREQFTYVLAVALLHRQDIHVQLPPWYEIFPNYFVRDSHVQKFREAKEKGVESLTLEENHSNTNDEVRYLKEDVQFNSQYYTWMLNWPTWLDYEHYGLPKWSRRGELMLYTNIQYAVRYGLELYAHGQGEGYFHGKKPIWNETLLDFDLRNSIGKKIPGRVVINAKENPIEILMRTQPDSIELLLRLDNLLNRFKLVLNASQIVNVTDIEDWNASMLGNIIFNTTESVNPGYYKSFIDDFIGALSELVDEKYKPEKNVLEYPMAVFRDRMYSTMLLLLDAMTRDVFDAHRSNEIEYSGVLVENIETDRLETFCDHLEFDATRAVDETGPMGRYKVRVKRLNHKPFNIRLNISSSLERPEKAYVRLFLVPDHFKSEEIKYYPHLFVPIDRFPITIVPGTNLIERSSKDSTVFVEDEDIAPLTYGDHVSKSDSQCGMPSNLMLPKGTKDGLSVLVLAVVSPAGKEQTGQGRTFDNFVTCGSPKEDDDRPLIFPIDNEEILRLTSTLPNVHMEQLTVYYNENS